MMKNPALFWYLLIYIFVIQFGVVGYLWSDASFYILAGINGLALIVGGYFLGSSSAKEKQEKKPDITITPTKIQEIQDLPNEDITPIETKSTQKPHSESNIEQVRARFNRTKAKPPMGPQAGGRTRFLLFLCALLGFGGVLFIMREMLDFIAMGLGALLMALFLTVSYKAMNIRKTSMFSSLYFLFFVAIFIMSIGGVTLSETNSVKLNIKNQISTFIAGLHGEVSQTDSQTIPAEGTGYLYETSGNVLSGETIETLGSGTNTPLTGESLTEVTTGEISTITTTGTIQSEISSSSTGKTNTSTPTTSIQTTQETSKSTTSEDTQVTILEAIKHLVKTYNLPLSTAKNTKFKYLSLSSSDYPYMKTALEKRMIGTSTNPSTILSCDTYMVMKGIALNWAIEKTSNLKADYRNVAENKGLLNGCIQGAKLTTTHL